MAKKKRDWKGALARPVEVAAPLWPVGATDLQIASYEAEFRIDAEQFLRRERLQKIPLLFEHYNIADDLDFIGLVLALAVDLGVPGFQRKDVQYEFSLGDSGLVRRVKTSGRQKDWTTERLEALYEAVQEEKHKKGVTEDRAALLSLARRRPWQPPANHRGTNQQWVETLESRLQEAKKFREAVERLDLILLKAIEDVKKSNSGNT